MIGFFDFKGADLSASCRAELDVPDNCNEMSIGLAWPATGSPVGVLSIEVGDTVGGMAAYSITISTHPSGTAGSIFLDRIKTSAKRIALVYTRTSGGTAAKFTNASGTAGTVPRCTFKVHG